MKKINERIKYGYESPMAEFMNVSTGDILAASGEIVEPEEEEEEKNWSKFY